MSLITICHVAMGQRGMTVAEIAAFLDEVRDQDAPLKLDYAVHALTTPTGMIQSLDVTLALNED